MLDDSLHPKDFDLKSFEDCHDDSAILGLASVLKIPLVKHKAQQGAFSPRTFYMDRKYSFTPRVGNFIKGPTTRGAGGFGVRSRIPTLTEIKPRHHSKTRGSTFGANIELSVLVKE